MHLFVDQPDLMLHIVNTEQRRCATNGNAPEAPSNMATRCDCRWERVELHHSLDVLLLRADDVLDCPAHSSVRAGEDTAV